MRFLTTADKLRFRGAWSLAVCFACAVFSLTWPKTAAAEQVLKFDDLTSLFSVEDDTFPTIKAGFVFWSGSKWQWEGLDVKAKPVADNGYDLTGTGNFSMDGTVRTTSPSSMTWDLKFDKSGRPELFGGMVFNLQALDGQPVESKLLPDRSGWEFSPRKGAEPVRVTFDPAPAELLFERGNSNEIRAYFLTQTGGNANVRMTVTVPATSRVAVSEKQRLRTPDETWVADAFPSRFAPIDLSFLNDGERPAGKRGFVRAVGENLQFEDGTPARFWGTNVTAYALFQTPQNGVVYQAKRLSKLGFNLVRIHHHDSSWVGFNVFGLDQDYKGELNAKAMEQLDWWIKCLRDEGIYVWLDLMVGRQFSSQEAIANFSEMSKGEQRGDVRGFNYINPDIQGLMKKFNADYLTHVNKYTKLAYGQDPAVIAYLITNENDLTMHFGNALLPVNVKEHGRIYMQASDDFAAANGLNREETWKSWEPGPSKLFLNDLEHKFNVTMTEHLRQIGARSMIVTTNTWGEMDISGLPSLTDGDIVDSHAYAKANELVSNPRSRSTMLSWMAAGFVAGKPATNTEWNVEPFPAFDRAALSPHVAAIASLQGWSALMQYAYTVGNLGGEAPGNYSASSDPAWLITFPVAALIYRQQHVKPAQKTYLLQFSPDQLVSNISPKTSKAIRTLTEVSKLRVAMPEIPSLPWLKATPTPEGAIIITDPGFDAIAADKLDHVCSDTGEVCRNWKSGILTVNTQRSQLAAGWLGGTPVTLGNAKFDMETPHATVALQSLDGKDIATSRKLLLTFTAQSLPSPGGKLPFLSEQVQGKVSVSAASGLKAYAIQSDGTRTKLPADYADGTYAIALTDKLKTFWITLTDD